MTVEGDRVDRKGALTGGYHDVRRSRLDQIKALRRWRDDYEKDVARHQEVKDLLNRIDQQVTHAVGQIQVNEAKRRQAMDVRARYANQSDWTKREEDQLRTRLENLEGHLEAAEAELKNAASQRSANEEELKTPLRQTLSAADLKELDDLTKDAEKQKKDMVDKSQARMKAAGEKSRMDIELFENYKRKREELRSKLDELDAGMGMEVVSAAEVESREAEMQSLVKAIDALTDQITGELGCDLRKEQSD